MLRIHFVCLTSLAMGVCTVAHSALPLDLTVRPLPQAYSDSCQSYGMALAAASIPGSPLKAANVKELRENEKAILRERDAIAKKERVDRLSHLVWPKALEAASAGILTADIRYLKTEAEWRAEVQKLTGISSPSTVRPTLGAMLVKTVVLTSVTALGKNTYPSHIIAVLGVENKANGEVLVLNPAIKVGEGPEKLSCEIDDTPGDAKYKSYVSIENSYILKPFRNATEGFLVMTVRKK